MVGEDENIKGIGFEGIQKEQTQHNIHFKGYR